MPIKKYKKSKVFSYKRDKDTGQELFNKYRAASPKRDGRPTHKVSEAAQNKMPKNELTVNVVAKKPTPNDLRPALMPSPSPALNPLTERKDHPLFLGPRAGAAFQLP